MKTNNKKCIVGLSGGVDSAVSAFLMKERGYNVIGCTLKLFGDKSATSENAENNIKDAKGVADSLGIPLEVLDCSEDFEKYVINYFVRYYMNGKTPSPCVLCNEYIKFKYLNEFRQKHNADLLVTGHYAKILRKTNENNDQKIEVELHQGAATERDQSYFLYAVDRDILMHAEFPLGDFKTKSDTRDIARKAGIKVAEKADSQDICFIQHNDYMKFLRKKLESDEIINSAGNIVDLNGQILGKHNGIAHYTIGQRKGLGLSGGPFFVNRIDVDKNEIVVSPKEKIRIHKLFLKNMKFINDPFEGECRIKIRSCGTKIAARIEKKAPQEERLEVTLLEPEYGAAEGQHCVFYDDDCAKPETTSKSETELRKENGAIKNFSKILGGGEIDSWL